MHLLVDGRQTALTVIFDRYHRLVFSVASRIVRDAGEAEEVVQTVFLDIFRAAASFDPRKGILKMWILQYAYHRALNRKRHLVASQFYRREELEAAIDSGANRVLSRELPEKLRLAQQMLRDVETAAAHGSADGILRWDDGGGDSHRTRGIGECDSPRLIPQSQGSSRLFGDEPCLVQSI